MSLRTDLSTFEVVTSRLAPGGATLTSVAISGGGTYFSVGDINGNIFVLRTDTQKLIRTFFLDGPVHILQFTQMRSKIILIAATKRGHLKAWQLNAKSECTKWSQSFPACINAIALNSRKDMLAVSVGLEVHLYGSPWDSGALSSPWKIWAPVTPAGGTTFYKYPLAIGLHFTPGNDLLISYLATHCIVSTKYPYYVVDKAAPELPSRIARVSSSPARNYAVSTNMNKGFDVFDLLTHKFTQTVNYPPTVELSNESYAVQTSFLGEDFLVTGHSEALVCIFELHGEDRDPLQIRLADVGEGYGIQHLATGMHKRNPFVIALSGKGDDSQYHLIASPHFQEYRELVLASSSVKTRPSTGLGHLCYQLFQVVSIASILVGLIMIAVAFVRVRGFSLGGLI